MKLTSLLTTTLAASAILFTACDKKEGGSTGSGSSGSSSSSSSSGGAATSEKDALARLEKDMRAIKADTEGMQQDPANPLGILAPIRSMLDKVIAIKTEGLPEDVKAPLVDAQAKMATVKDAFKDVPAVADMKELTEKLQTDPALAAKLQKVMTEELPKAMEAVGPAMTKVDEALKKHGIDIK